MDAAVTYFDGEMLRPGTVASDAGTLTLRPDPAPGRPRQLDGVITGRFMDHHVHLQLIDHAALATSLLGRVIDLGGDLDVVRGIRDVAVEYAGPFLTAPGGYPSDRSWAPTGSVHEVTDATAAASVVHTLADAGARWIKVVAHSGAGPELADALVTAIVHAAADRGLPVIAHAEGPGQAQRVARLGASHLAHAPFTERLDDAEIAVQAASVTWVSTMAIHGGTARAHVIDNVRRFVAAGGILRYGTDMGNGPGPVDLRGDEVAALRAAGVDGVDLLRALAPADPAGTGDLLFLPDGDPLRARPLTPVDLEA